MMFLPLYMNLDPEKRERERKEVHQVMLQHLKHQLVLTGMTTWMTLFPPNQRHSGPVVLLVVVHGLVIRVVADDGPTNG